MIIVSILYPNEAEKTFDMAYYLNRHIPRVNDKIGDALKGRTVEQGLSGLEPGIAPAYVAMSHLWFDSVEAFQNAFVDHEEEIRADIINFTDIKPTIQISEVKI